MIDQIHLSWFRGAAEAVTLHADSKSLLVYGENASGKSSFVDAVEFFLNEGKLGHLTHEYSGRFQEKGLLNTHIPEDRNAEVSIKFSDESEVRGQIETSGNSSISGDGISNITKCEYWHTVLRQDEVASFIKDTKLGKYSTLLPLLGLHHFEIAAENVRQLTRSVEQQTSKAELSLSLKRANLERQATFGEISDDGILHQVKSIHKKYCSTENVPEKPLDICDEILVALEESLLNSSQDQRRQVILLELADSKIVEFVDASKLASAKLAEDVEPRIVETLEVIKSALKYSQKLDDGGEIKCPACGKVVPSEEFKSHLVSESERLQDISTTFEVRKVSIQAACNSLRQIKSALSKEDMQSWREEEDNIVLQSQFTFVDELDMNSIAETGSEVDLIKIEAEVVPIIEAAKVASKDSPPDAQQLSVETNIIKTAREVFVSLNKAIILSQIETLTDYLTDFERVVRQEIRDRSERIINEISSHIQRMWQILHPGEQIEDVKLYLPQESDKAIDVELKFFGVSQNSPRLTLSEGYRNSLGLCIFLSMAQQESGIGCPLFLDDVVVSLDRNHRGMIAQLLEEEFSDRQIIVFTHDRVWYTELRQQLDDRKWNNKVLMPWLGPETGIRVSEKSTSFDDARSQLVQFPDSAGNTARKIMDIELALIAEKLKLKMPYLYMDKNDHRTWYEFLSRIISDGKKCFQKKIEETYVTYNEAISAFENASTLLTSWGNRGSHTFDIVKSEAERLIDVCENCLEFFKCSKCQKTIYRNEDSQSKTLQCQCGELRWRYGKA